jgi:hypothetical protein
VIVACFKSLFQLLIPVYVNIHGGALNQDKGPSIILPMQTLHSNLMCYTKSWLPE